MSFDTPVATSRSPGGTPPWRQWRGQAALLAGLASLLLLTAVAPRWLTRLDLIAYDGLSPRRPDALQPAIVVAVDAPSLAALGRWPWPRSIHAELIEALRVAGAAVIAMPVIFAEPDPEPGHDVALAGAITRHGKVVLPLVPIQRGDGMAASYPVEPLRSSGAALGHVDVEIDTDGQIRSLFLRAGVGQSDHPALALAAYQLMSPGAVQRALPGLHAATADGPSGNPTSWLRTAQVLLPRMPRQPPRISYASALRTPEVLGAVRGRAVFVGLTESGLGGELASPVLDHPGMLSAVDLHAHVYDSLRAGALITPASSTLRWAYALALLTLLVLWPLRHRVSPAGSMRVLAWMAGAVALLPLAVSAGLLTTVGVWLAPVTATLSLADRPRNGPGAACARQPARTRAAARTRTGHTGRHRRRRHLGRPANDHPVCQPARRAAVHRGIGPRTTHRLRARTGAGEPGPVVCLAGRMPARRHRGPSEQHPERDLMPQDRMYASCASASAPLRNSEGQPDGAVIVVSDVTDAVASANRLQFAATHDMLTGLPNRALLQERLTLALARVQRLDSRLAVLFLDLNRFKRINDSLGPSAGRPGAAGGGHPAGRDLPQYRLRRALGR